MTQNPADTAPVVLVTGSTRGIGAAIAETLRARGAHVIGHGRHAGAGTVPADLADPSAVHALWETALALGRGRIDVLINNAGIFVDNPLERSDFAWLDGWEETMRINLTAAAQLSRLAVLHWLEQGRGGRAVHIASRAAHRGDSPDHWHYAAAKGGMVALHKTIARGYAHQGILSFAISPGFVATRMACDYLTDNDAAALAAQIPLGRIATAAEIAAIAAFCALDAPASMTGAVIDANGASHVR
jgi:NAD(P)-dependent dehydrogenase (short-subunit alcohol dehydrogenase family)